MPRPDGTGEVQRPFEYARFKEVGDMFEGVLVVKRTGDREDPVSFFLEQDGGPVLKLPKHQHLNNALDGVETAIKEQKKNHWVSVELTKNETEPRRIIEYKVTHWPYDKKPYARHS